MPTSANFYSVGTVPLRVLPQNPNRVGWRVTMYSTTIEAGNTGRVHLARNMTPTATTGQPNSGDILVQGAELSEEKSYPEEEIFTGDLWLIASAADQRVQVEETVKRE